METLDKVKRLAMGEYKKPCIVAESNVKGFLPFAALAGMSAAQLAGVATVAGLAYGMVATEGTHDIVPFRSGLVLQEL